MQQVENGVTDELPLLKAIAFTFFSFFSLQISINFMVAYYFFCFVCDCLAFCVVIQMQMNIILLVCFSSVD